MGACVVQDGFRLLGSTPFVVVVVVRIYRSVRSGERYSLTESESNSRATSNKKKKRENCLPS